MTSTNTNSRKTQTLPPPLNIPEFPGEEAIEEFEHDSLAQYDGVDFYVDENANVWDENMTFVGKYDQDENALAIVEGYEPEVDED